MIRLLVTAAGRRGFAVICGATLFVLLCLTVIDVAGRETLNRQLLGGYELSELTLLVLFFLALPSATARDEHITVTPIDRWLAGRWRSAVTTAIDLLTAAMLLALTPYIWRHAAEIERYGDVTLYLQLPAAPFAYLAAAMTGLTGLLVAIRLVLRVARPSRAQGSKR